MTDRELLENAAKAAGLGSHRYCEPWSAMAAYTLYDGYHGPSWNPLTNDGDALRLAVKLGIDVSFPLYRKPDPPTVHAGRYWDTYVSCWYPFEERKGEDPYAATRRAIVRAAAEIGRSMK
jgi:hypothetical protein